MKFNDTQKNINVILLDGKQILLRYLQKKPNKQTTDNKNKKSKTALEDYEADFGDWSTFPRSTYINSLHNSSPHSPIARYTFVLTVSTLDFQHGTEEIFFSKETGLVLELAKQG